MLIRLLVDDLIWVCSQLNGGSEPENDSDSQSHHNDQVERVQLVNLTCISKDAVNPCTRHSQCELSRIYRLVCAERMSTQR